MGFERPTSGRCEAVFRLRPPPLEGFCARDVAGFLELAGVNAQVSVGGFHQLLEIGEAERVVDGERHQYDRHGEERTGKVLQVLGFMGLERRDVPEGQAGDIIAISGVEGLSISDTVCQIDVPEALEALTVDEPTISMTFQVNNSPFAGNKDRSGGKFITSRQIRERLNKELQTNVAMRVDSGRTADEFLVSGRGVLSLGILIENMRREGFELSVGKPEVIIREIDGEPHEPIEELVVDVPNTALGSGMERVGSAHPAGKWWWCWGAPPRKRRTKR